MEEKFICETCGRLLEEKYFYKDSKRSLGLKLDACKECRHKRYLQNKEYRISYAKKWNKENKEKCKAYHDHYMAKKLIAATL